VVLGFADKGRIVTRGDADLTVLNPAGAVQETVVAGDFVYKVKEA
jgi:N-acetylglucosamine-6-phosphate deacetylase